MIGYNGLAKSYDLLQGFVFGQSLVQVQQELIQTISEGSRILFIGGGTGQILPELLEQEPASIDYVDFSSEMIAIAKKRGDDRVNFIEQDVRDFEGAEYDIIIVFFVLDVFSIDDLYAVSKKVVGMLKGGGKLLYADFAKPTTMYQEFLLWLMIRFFRVTTRIDTVKLLDHAVALQATGLIKAHEVVMKSGFVRGVVFEK